MASSGDFGSSPSMSFFSTYPFVPYVNRVVAAIDGLDQEVILVGHSMGGIVVSQAAEYRPNRIKSLVYLTAFLLQNGQNMLVFPPNPNMRVFEGGSTINVPADKAKDTFYNNCLDEELVGAVSRLQVQATNPFVTPVCLTQKILVKSLVTTLKAFEIMPYQST
ncbi:alpha/beta fold hydrolase [Paenibacillus sp. WC2504]|uniref:alpha/beta fold hydrolase n=1 Tax=Paenibacillus sp. WC2504 TaxID=3461403 RepID=UPI0040468506